MERPMIVISRKTGEILSAPETTQEKRDAAWEHIFDAYINKHPEVLYDLFPDLDTPEPSGL